MGAGGRRFESVRPDHLISRILLAGGFPSVDFTDMAATRKLSLAKQMTILLVAALLPAVLTAVFHPKRPVYEVVLQPGEVTLSTVLSWDQDSLLWIDARDRSEFERDRVPGAVLLNEDEWEALFFDLLEHDPLDRVMVVYCGSRECAASQRVAERLRRDLGEEIEVHVLHGGWNSWTDR